MAIPLAFVVFFVGNGYPLHLWTHCSFRLLRTSLLLSFTGSQSIVYFFIRFLCNNKALFFRTVLIWSHSRALCTMRNPIRSCSTSPPGQSWSPIAPLASPFTLFALNSVLDFLDQSSMFNVCLGNKVSYFAQPNSTVFEKAKNNRKGTYVSLIPLSPPSLNVPTKSRLARGSNFASCWSFQRKSCKREHLMRSRGTFEHFENSPLGIFNLVQFSTNSHSS